MKSECINYPERNHEACQLEPHEKVVADYFESHGLDVERLCAVKSRKNEKVPDFRFTNAENFVCICEIKKLESPMGNLTKTDKEYLDRTEFEKLVEEARKQNVLPIVTAEQWDLYQEKKLYPDEERNTSLKEKENAKKLKKWLNESSVEKSLLTVTISRHDSFHWTEEELHDFANYLIDSLRSIKNGEIPPYWSKDFHTINGHYRKVRRDEQYIQNQIQVVQTGDKLSVDVQFSMGMNWEGVVKNCRKAQNQIKSQLQHESAPEKVIRLLVMFLEQDLYFQYFSEIDKLEMDINRRILQKFQELSAVAFCTISFSPVNFMVFHATSSNIPPLPEEFFDLGNSLQFPK